MEISTAPIQKNSTDYRLHLLARMHDAMQSLARAMKDLLRHRRWDTCVGRLDDGRPFCAEFVCDHVSLTLYPFDAALDAHDASKDGRPFRRSRLRYVSASQIRPSMMQPLWRDRLSRYGVDLRENGITVVACTPVGVVDELPDAYVEDLLRASAAAIDELRLFVRQAA